MKISIVIPMLNEMATLPDLLTHLHPFKREGCEIIFVDGGSSDASIALAESAGCTTLHSEKGRARQMNLGAAHASGEVILFLHADTRLPQTFIQAISNLTSQGQYQWGRFDVVISGHSPLLKMVSFMMNMRSRLTHIATGDQAIFIRRSLFLRINGFTEQPLMEDIELCNRLKSNFPPACLYERVITSGRRWETHGIWRTIFLMWTLRWYYWRGVSLERIAIAYQNNKINFKSH